ncbi:hypothetical protein [Streptomyces sp. NPDC058401]|uniref:hypothetical protein n=1 Tax=Streptomyces sp. NPDC058401 TaxID=3346480 RepID=UPI003649629F
MDDTVPRRPKTKKKSASLGIPREIVLVSAAEGVWPYAFTTDGAGGACGRVPVPADASVEDVQAAILRQLADLTRTLHGVESSKPRRLALSSRRAARTTALS